MSRIEKLDENFVTGKVEAGVRWIDIRELGGGDIEGRGYSDTESFYDRWPARAKALVPEKVWELSHHSAGMAVRFVTDASVINARWTLLNKDLAMDHMPATGVSGLDLYTRVENGWRWLGVGRPTATANQFPLTGELSPGTREMMLYLPLYNGVTEVFVGIPEGARIGRAPAWPADRQKPLCFYGTSVVQGGCASRPGMTYAAIIARHLDRPHFNFGFSGNGRCEPAVAELLAELDVAAHIIDPLPNMSLEQITERLANFVRILRAKRPAAPIVLIENIIYRYAYATPSRMDRVTSANAALREIYAQLQQEIGGLHYVHADKLYGDDGEGTVDGAHATDLGFMRMADAIGPAVERALAY